MSTSARQVARLLAMIPYLQQHQGVPLSTVAQEFGITAAQVRRDLDVAYFCGLPGGLPGDLIEVDMDAVDGEGVVNLTNADVLSRPMRFTPDEAVSLILALQAIRAVASPTVHGAVDSALGKLTALAGDAAAQAVMTVASGADPVRAVVSEAVDRGRRLRLTYDGLSRGETTYPIVDPMHLEIRDGAAYLEAWSVAPQGWRTYRLDRIVTAEETGDDVDPRPVPSRRGWLDPSSGHAVEVTLWVASRAAWVSEYYPTVRTQRAPDGLLVVLMVADPTWLRRLLLRLGADARVVHPSAASDASVVAAREALHAYEAAGLGSAE